MTQSHSIPNSDDCKGKPFFDRNWGIPRFSSPISFLSLNSFRKAIECHVSILFLFLFVLDYSNLCVDAQVTSLAGCEVASTINNFDQIKNDPNLDLFPVKSTPLHQDEWNVRYYPTFKFAWNSLTKEYYVLYFRGTPIPVNGSLATFPTGTKFFSVPIQRTCVDSTVASAFIEMLGVRSTIQAMDTTYAESACLLQMTQMGLSSFPSAYGNATLRNIIINTKCDLVDGDSSSGSKSITDSVSYETSLIGRSEWIKFHALFYNKEAAANLLFQEIQDRYTTLSQAAQLAANQTGRPIVAWINQATYYNPPQYQIEYASIRLDSIIQAGGTPFNPSTRIFYSPNALINALVAANVNIVIDETYIPPGQQRGLSTFLNLWNITNNATVYPFLPQVWRNDRNVYQGSDDWFESAYPNADAVLNDLVAVIHPTVPNLSPRIWFRNLYNGEGQFALISTCSSLTAPSIPYIQPVSNTPYTCPGYLLNPYTPATTAAPTSTPTTAAPTTSAPTSSPTTGSVTTARPANHAGSKFTSNFISVILILCSIFVAAILN